jgi:hypothetical protein
MSLHDIAGPAVAVSPERGSQPALVYLPQSFPGIVWHQHLLDVDAAAVGVVEGAGVGAGENRETRNAKRVSMGVNVPFS